MEKGEKIIISVVVLVTIVVIVGAAVVIPTMMQEMQKPESCATVSYTHLRAHET